MADTDFGDIATGLVVTMSAGVADGGSDTLERLLNEADARLYRAKSGGRNRVAWQEREEAVAPAE